MRWFQRILPTAMILLTLPLLWIFVSPYFGIAQKVGRSGTFTLLGTLTYADGRPVVGKDIDIQEVNKKGEIVFKIVDNAWFAGYAKTNDNGRFRVEVNRRHFDGDRIRFTIRVRLSGGDIPQEIRDKWGIFVIFEVDEQTKVLDLDKLVGPITVRTK
jgi:hypothetical protein